MIQITYISSATEPMSTPALLSLLQSCRENNAGRGVTGMLFHCNGTFLQVLEGEERVIDELLDIIEQDPRHTGMQVIQRKEIKHRQYSDWSMGFQRVSERDLRQIEGLRDFSEKDFNADYLGQQSAVVQSLMDHFRRQRLKTIGQSELGVDEEDRMINILHRIIRGAVRVLAVLMVITILWGVVDVAYSLYGQLFVPAVQDFGVRDIVVTFGAFLAVLIAIEIFMNITLYLRDDVVHVRLVIATALMAIARKVIIFDFEKLQPMYILATAAVILALGLVYWLMDRKTVLGARYQRPVIASDDPS
ncbi:phosphate-starvation-inducible PsiE family protein [Thiocystis violacea]|uniref:phosphate-starvation-inducible PsiE family protein n=1 Tax=Thiocystis violacea TaxID=13725 RepID=UPI0019067F79|nr:phosphate-starvation-inducible PsiE family protein [Thiocystis violacea]MBK1724709.1 blue light sensor protein [Thiocystis violacea]